MPPQEPVLSKPLGQCPGCGRDIGDAIDKDGKPFGMIHVAPTCEDFDKRDALEFIIWVREQRGLPPAAEDAEH